MSSRKIPASILPRLVKSADASKQRSDVTTAAVTLYLIRGVYGTTQPWNSTKYSGKRFVGWYPINRYLHDTWLVPDSRSARRGRIRVPFPRRNTVPLQCSPNKNLLGEHSTCPPILTYFGRMLDHVLFYSSVSSPKTFVYNLIDQRSGTMEESVVTLS